MTHPRDAFHRDHPEVYLLDVDDREGLEAYLRQRSWLAPDEAIDEVRVAGEGNMNCTLRVRTSTRDIVVKQGRPWVEKYSHIPAPWSRTLVEAAFYEIAARVDALASRMPRFYGVDEVSRIVALEALDGTDLTSLYSGETLATDDLDGLTRYLAALATVRVTGPRAELLRNRKMRALNHLHIFDFPLQEANGLDLDPITPGLSDAARRLKANRSYVARVRRLGEHYLADGSQLVHGDYFPGSWLRTPDGLRVIDPEFCFLGAAGFDVGVMLGHALLSGQPAEVCDAIEAAGRRLEHDEALVRGFAGVEIMRRLIGVAQLPLACGLDTKLALLDRSEALVGALRT